MSKDIKITALSNVQITGPKLVYVEAALMCSGEVIRNGKSLGFIGHEDGIFIEKQEDKDATKRG